MAGVQTTDVFFIIDGTRLEAQACLLAPTLHKHLSRHQKAAAYIRQDYRDHLGAMTLEVLEASGVELREIPDTDGTHAPWTDAYPQGNKILAAALPRKCDISVFLDTDTVMTRPINFAAELGQAMLGACVSDYASGAHTDEDWAAYYAAFDMEPPTQRVRYNGGRRLLSYPYYNAGVVVFRERVKPVKGAKGAPKATGIGQDWLDVAVTFDHEVNRDYPRANIDQYTLPILGYRRGTPVKALKQRMNFNIEAFGQGEGQEQWIAHYHRPGILWAHHEHGRMALQTLVDLIGPDAPERFVQDFGEHAKRKRMKRHIQAIAEQQSLSA